MRWHVWGISFLLWLPGMVGKPSDEALPMSVDAVAWVATLRTESPEEHLKFVTQFPESKYASCAAQRMLWLLRQQSDMQPYRKTLLPLLVSRIHNFPPFHWDAPVDLLDPYAAARSIDERWWLYGLPEAERERVFRELLNGYVAILTSAEDDDMLDHACRALGEFGDPAALQSLISILERGGDASGSAMKAISRLDDPRAVAILLPRLPHRSSYVTIEVSETLSHAACIPALCELARASNTWTRREACEALGSIGDARGMPTLLARAVDEEEDEWVRQSAIEALGRIGNSSAVPVLAATIEVEQLYNESIAALGRIPSRSAVKRLAQNIVKQRGILAHMPSKALACNEHPESVSLLLNTLLGIDETFRYFGNDHYWVEPIFFGAADERRRYTRGTCVARVWTYQSIDRLLPALDHESNDVRGVAIHAIGLAVTRDPRAVNVLVPLLKDEAVAASAAFALGSFGDSRATQPLVAALKHKDALVRRFAAYALGELGDPTAVAPLLELLKDKDASFAAVQALGKMKAQEAAPHLATMLKSMPQTDEKLRTWARMSTTNREDLLDALRAIEDGDQADFASQDRMPTLVERPEHELEAMLFDPDLSCFNGREVFDRLTRRGRLPCNADETVRYLILTGARHDLIALWPRTKRLLFTDLHSHSPDRLLYAARCLIRIGYGDETIPELVAVSEKSEDERMARDFINSDNEQLRQAALAWSERTGRSLDSQRPATLAWGAMKDQ